MAQTDKLNKHPHDRHIFEVYLSKLSTFSSSLSTNSQFIIKSVIIGLVSLILIFFSVTQYKQTQLQKQFNASAQKAYQQIDSELAKFQQIPNLLDHDPRIAAYFEGKLSSETLNELLKEWSVQSLADTIYINDLSGVSIAASNHDQPNSFVGNNYAFRPYFQQAIKGQSSQYVGLGISSNKRGYYFSSPLFFKQTIVGVLTVKVSLENIEQLIRTDNMQIMVIDSNNIVFLSSFAPWLYQSVSPLNAKQHQVLQSTRQYGVQEISLLTEPNISPLFAADLTLPTEQLLSTDDHYLYAQPSNTNGYQILALQPKSQLLIATSEVAIIYLLVYSLLIVVTWYWRQTYHAKNALLNLNQALESKVEKRTQFLQHANEQLENTIFQYQQSQHELKQTQHELTQAAKLALLGELSASINHEINQPLTAMRTYSENSLRLLEMGHLDLVTSNLNKMVELNQTVGDIISRLKVFTRKSTQSDTCSACVHLAINNAIGILSTQAIRQGVTLRIPAIANDQYVAIHSVQLEQVLVNLIHNALQALTESHNPQIGIEWEVNNREGNLHFWDNGPGINDTELTTLFDPFFTTKPEGLGLGLTITKRIIEAHHGYITAHNREEGGLAFTIRLPLARSNHGSVIKEEE